jgi:predicted ATPase
LFSRVGGGSAAEAFGLDSRGGRAGRKYGNSRDKTRLGKVLRLGLTHDGARMKTGARSKQRGYLLRAETTFGFAEVVSGRSCWTPPTGPKARAGSAPRS